ncbi:TonB-dependent receptor plug domain-containing protein, partial [Gluconobacter albidus]
MSTSRRHLLLCASILGVGTLSGTAFAASTSQPEHRSHKAVHHKATTSTAAAKTAKPAVAAPVAASSVAVPVATTAPAFSSRRRAEVLEAQGVSGGSERMVVTGSALASSNNQNANPVQIVTAKQIQQTGATTLSDFFARIPSIGGTGTNNSETNGTGGASCTDIRNLGSNRVLVLIDGKRATLNGQTNCIDLNALPVQQIASVEILKDGGSELYGADAVSGVINIKMRHDLSDGNITIRGGITGHGDNDTGMISAYKGWNFDHDKGNLTLFGQYMTQGGVLQRNRGWANPVQLTDNPVGSGGETFGSGYSNYTHVQNSTTNLNAAVAPDGKTVSTWGASNRYPYGEHQSLINQLQNSSLSGDFHYQFNRHANLYSNVMYSHRTSSSYMAAEPFDGSVPPSTLPSVLTVPANDPNNPFGQDVDITKRLTELGDRRDENATDTVTAKVGVNGAIAYGWDYDVSYTYGSNMSTDHLENVGSYTNLLNAYGLQQVDPSNSASALVYNPSVCPSFGCSNPFGTMGKQAASYVNYNTNTHSHYQLRDWNLRINNNHVTTMPWKGGGDLGMAFGFEHRGEQLTNTPDELISSGQSLTNTVLPTSGGFDVTEGYAEAKATLLKNVFLAKDLTIDAQGRASGYSTTSDTAKNWKASINWAPTQDIRFRGTIGTSYRQPNVYELYGGQSLS